MKILIVSSGNTCRSPMAEALLKRIAGEDGNASAFGRTICRRGRARERERGARDADMGLDISAHGKEY